MGNKGRVRKFFPGANSAYGFYSLYSQLYSPACEKVFILKGGPGTGKSTLLQGIGEAMRLDGFDVEYHYCSANPISLDGVVIPTAGVALLDGTAPHVVDPRYPGAVEEIVNLGDFWDEPYLVKQKEAIRSLVDSIGLFYQRAYIYLAAAKSYRDVVDSYYGLSNHKYITDLNTLALELVEEILNGKNRVRGRGGQRKLFASAITSQGSINHLENLVSPFSLVFMLGGGDGSNKRKLIERVADAAVMRGFYVETFCCALDPLQVDHIVIPELEVALVNNMEPHRLQLGQIYRHVDTDRLAANLPEKENREKEDFYCNYRQVIQKAIDYLVKANKQHDELEQYYIPTMRYDEIEDLGQQVLEKVRKLTRSSKQL